MIILHLFIANLEEHWLEAIRLFETALKEELQCPLTLHVVDVLKHRRLAELNNVDATPTLIRMRPPPVKKYVGDFHDVEKVIQELDLLAS